MANSVRITKAQRFEDIVALLNGNATKYGTTVKDAEDFIAHEVELLAKKNSAVDKRKAANAAKDATFKEMIVDYLATVENGMTCSEIGKAVPDLSDFSTSKLSSLCNGLVTDGRLVKASVKGKSIFSLA